MNFNPYVHRGPIDDPAHFYGRRNQLKTTFNFLQQGQCLSITGLRRIGKTSLLLQLKNAGVAELAGLDLEIHKKMRFIYLDTHILSALEAEEIYHRLAGEVVQQFESEASKAVSNLAGFERFQQSLQLAETQNCTAIFLLDEFERLASNPNLNRDFFGQLRLLAAPFNPLIYITASHRPLAELTYRDNMLGSPFFGIFQPLRLASLAKRDAQTLIKKPAHEAGLKFSTETENFILELTGGHPFATQIACYHAFELQQQFDHLETDDFSEIEELTYADMHAHLTGYWEELSAEEQAALTELGLGKPTSRKNYRNLQAKGLVTRQDKTYQPFSRLFSLFITTEFKNSATGDSTSVQTSLAKTAHSEELTSLKRQLIEFKRNLLTIEEQKTEFIDPRSVPPDLAESKRLTSQKIAQIESRLAELEA